MKSAKALFIAAALAAASVRAGDCKIVTGYQLDISRYKVPTMQTLYRIVDFIARLGYTQFQLYTEHTFAYKGHEEVWCEASPMTPEEVRALDDYCSQRGIELVPNQNSFGHLENWLRHPGYNHLAEAPKGGTTMGSYTLKYPMCLCPTDPRSVTFIAGLYDQLLPCFRSRKINVGGDETIELKDDHKPGIGRSAAELAAKGPARVYLEFLGKIHKLLSDRGHTMMFWGDIILEHPELISELPEDVIALNWGYEADHPFETSSAAFAKSKRRFYVCPGTSAWGTFSGRTDNMMVNVDSAISAGERHGMSGVLLADWGDYGHPNPFLSSVPALVYTANRVRGVKLDRAGLAAEIDRILGCKVGDALLRYGDMYKKTGPVRGGGSYWFKVLSDAGNFERPEGMSDEVIADAWKYLAAAKKDVDLSSAPDWVKDDFRMLDLLFEAVRLRLENPRMRNFRAVFEPEYRKLWLSQNRLGGLETSLVYLFGPRR